MSLIVLGTASHVGKSITVAAICRALVRRGIKVAPFKSQNMSLNSFVTADGKEIGIAQAVQSWAAGLDPEADMNPILLKPKGEGVSQIILLGNPYRDMPITEYYQETDFLLGEALSAFFRLQTKYGQVVVEGAGGAAEVNLYDRDIANIRLARALRLPIVLVADIERGGVFAQIYGTIKLLPEDIVPLLAGIIVNKFRGDLSIFQGGVEQIEELTGLPVLGVMPYMDIALPSEDSLSIKDKKAGGGAVRIGVIRLPHISNFTDFETLERNAAVEYVPLGKPLSSYDCIIIPGTKNTVDDLRLLKESGTAEEILKARQRRAVIIGICGGYQMIGKTLLDSGVESCRGTYEGLGLLDVATSFEGYQKTTIQVRRRARQVPPILSGMGTVSGYEIHMGGTALGTDREAFEGEGAVSPDGRVFGTYMHGLFLNPAAIESLLSYLYREKGQEFTGLRASQPVSDIKSGNQDPYDALAIAFEEHVDMDYIESFFTGTRHIPNNSTNSRGQE
jgi:adenosylcobyric acid synthase